jgi:predicted RNase H-like HicB family nuclease
MSHEERRTFTLAVVVEPAEEAWHAYCPALLDYGAATWGTTREEALEQIRAVVTMLVERMAAEETMPVLAEPADPVPTPTEQVVVTVGVPTA